MTLSNRRRDAMIHAVVSEMTAWNPHERAGMFRQWLLGSLSIVHLHVLTILETAGPLPMGKLAESLDVSVASATGIVDRMEQRGLVERRHDETDRRVVLVHRTPAGEAVFTDLQKQRQAGLEHVLGRLTNDELKALLIGIRALSKARADAIKQATGIDARDAEQTLAATRRLGRQPAEVPS
jgi:DNA-binding MarR family transcriptional regulator